VKGDREQRRVVLRRLLAVKAELGEVPNSAVDAAAHMLGLSVRQVRRLVATGGDADPVEAFDLTKQMIDHLFAARGNALKAHERLIAAHVDLPVGPRQFQRAVEQHVDQALRAAAKRGLDGFIASTVYLGGPVAHRNEIWAIDHTPAPVAVRPRTRGLAPYIPWTTTLMDKGTGAWMAGTVKDSDPNAADAIATLGRGVAGFTLRDGTFAGGLPDVLLSDRGGDLISDPATIGLARVLVNRRYTEPGSPWQNGKVERLQGLWQSDWCTSLPGYLFGDRFSYQRKLNLAMSNPENLLFEDQFAALFAKEIERRNEEHVSNGRTAAQRWAADTTPLRLAEPEVIRLAMLRDETRIVHKGTIEFRGHLYVAPELKTRSKTKVDIRYMPGESTSIEVYYLGKHLCQALRREELTLEQRGRIMAERKAQKEGFREHLAQGDRINAETARRSLREMGYAEDDLPGLVTEARDGHAEPATEIPGQGDMLADLLNLPAAAATAKQQDRTVRAAMAAAPTVELDALMETLGAPMPEHRGDTTNPMTGTGG